MTPNHSSTNNAAYSLASQISLSPVLCSKVAKGAQLVEHRCVVVSIGAHLASHLALSLAMAHCNVIVLCSQPNAERNRLLQLAKFQALSQPDVQIPLLLDNVHFQQIDLFDEADLAASIRPSDVIFNLVRLWPYGSPLYPTSADSDLWTYHFRAMQLLGMVALKQGAARLVHLGSLLSLGRNPQTGIADEEQPLLPDDNRSLFERTLFRQEMVAWQMAERGLSLTVLNAGLPFGPCTELGHWLYGSVAMGSAEVPNVAMPLADVNLLTLSLMAAESPLCNGHRLAISGDKVDLRTLAKTLSSMLRLDGHRSGWTKIMTRIRCRLRQHPLPREVQEIMLRLPTCHSGKVEELFRQLDCPDLAEALARSVGEPLNWASTQIESLVEFETLSNQTDGQ